ncbi:mevalonate kinase [Nocardia transvalensis]|uniref:mevalonate kinase n=1 Tax=Nocardia transvalensis TaxID=37333 RepID=UPI0018961C81|nr:mevalonate kinase [Nocardia transvalensis]MBF6329424.1 mevalonate kinase [Nocardia transvalensis]
MAFSALGIGSAHAKTILLGEHAVVYGAPAVVFPLHDVSVRATAVPTTGVGVTVDGGSEDEHAARLGVVVTDLLAQHRITQRGIDIRFDCGIPPGRGLGSSAACVRAALAAVADLFDLALEESQLYDLVQAAERGAHGTASGIDAAATGSAHPLLFVGGTATPCPFAPGATLVVADSGVTGSTRDAVAHVRRLFTENPARGEDFTARCTGWVTEAMTYLPEAQWQRLGSLLLDNHGALAELGLSTVELDRLVQAAADAGAAGAKLTGGGLGGCIVALVPPDRDVAAVTGALRAAGATAVWTVPTDTLGLDSPASFTAPTGGGRP